MNCPPDLGLADVGAGFWGWILYVVEGWGNLGLKWWSTFPDEKMFCAAGADFERRAGAPTDVVVQGDQKLSVVAGLRRTPSGTG
jgi:hypothetical protein